VRVPCGRTISVLPDHFLPYRAVCMMLVEKYFDAQANPSQVPPPATQKEKGCLKRAWARFKQCVAPLSATLGQMVRPVKPAAAHLWKQLRRKSNLSVNLAGVGQAFQHLFAPRLPLLGAMLPQRRLRRFIPESLLPARRPVRRRRRPTHRSDNLACVRIYADAAKTVPPRPRHHCHCRRGRTQRLLPFGIPLLFQPAITGKEHLAPTHNPADGIQMIP